MESWRKERDTLVSALEIQLKKLITSNAEKDQHIKILQSTETPQTPEVSLVSDTNCLYVHVNFYLLEINILLVKSNIKLN